MFHPSVYNFTCIFVCKCSTPPAFQSVLPKTELIHPITMGCILLFHVHATKQILYISHTAGGSFHTGVALVCLVPLLHFDVLFVLCCEQRNSRRLSCVRSFEANLFIFFRRCKRNLFLTASCYFICTSSRPCSVTE